MFFHKTIIRFSLLAGLVVAGAFGQSTQPLAFGTPGIFNPSNSPNLVVGEYNTAQFQITGGTAPYSLALSSGTLPTGLAFDPNIPINLQGIPTAPGTFTFTLTATDSSTPTPQAVSQSFTLLAVSQPLVIAPAGSLEGGVVGLAYGAGSTQTALYARGGIPPYRWSLLQGTLPPGLSNAATTPAFGNGTPPSEITGTPTTPGTFSFKLQLQDSSPTPITVTQTFALSVVGFTSFSDPKAAKPFGITTGPDGALWFTQQLQVAAGQLGAPIYGLESVSTAGGFGTEIQLTTQVTSVSGSLVYPYPQAITLGPDGNFWMTDNQDGYIVQASTSGPGTIVPLHAPSGAALSPTGITSGGPVGGVWFTAVQGGSPGIGVIGRINPANPGSPSYYEIPQQTAYPTSIIQNPQDGSSFWFLDQGGNVNNIAQDYVVIGRITVPADPSQPPTFALPAGCQASNQALGFPSTLSECVIAGTQGHVAGPFYGGGPTGPLLQVDSQGTVWFATKDQIGSITKDGSVAHVYALPVTDATFSVSSIALGSDGAIWYVAHSPADSLSVVGRVTTSGAVEQFLYPTSTDLEAITPGPDGALWITDADHNQVLRLFPSLALNCTVPGTLQVGVPIANASCSAFGGKAPYSYSFDTSNLPPGVTVSASGVLSGTPTGPGSFTITATDSSAPVQQATQVISILAAPTIQLVCNFPATGAAGQPYAGSCTTAGGTPPYTFTVSPSLPAGLTGVATTPSSGGGLYGFNVTGTLSPSAGGTISFAIKAADSTQPIPNTSAPQTVSIAVKPLPVALSCDSKVQAAIGKPYQQQCFGSGGSQPYTFTATGLPPGLTINSTTGVISGIATTLGQYPASALLTDGGGQTASQAITFSVINLRLALVCNFSGFIQTGIPYSSACTAFGGTGPYVFAISAGTLPTGLTLNPATGAVTGTPTKNGPYAFTVQVTDSESPAVTAQQSLSFDVFSPHLSFVTTTLPTPNAALPYAVEALIAGGKGPFVFSVVAGALPAGLQLDPATGIISSMPGVPLAAGDYSYTLQVSDSIGETATQAYSGTVSAMPLQQSFASYALPGPSGANGITVGPDNALWFTTLDQAGGNLIGRLTTSGVLTTVPATNPLTQSNPANLETPAGGDIATGLDGQIWVAQRDGNAISAVSADLSSQSTYLPPTPGSGPAQITAAQDGTLWFTEAAASKIGRVDPGGNFTEIATPSPASAPAGIAIAPDGSVVFTEPGVNKIGIITRSGTATEVAIPTANSLPTSIVLGSDNAFWFTESGANQIGRLDFSGNIKEYPVSSAPLAITLGTDLALYFTENSANKIGRMTILGAVTEIPIPDTNSGPTGIVPGPGGSLYFTENSLSRIARLSFVFGPTVTCTLPASPLQAGSTFTGTCTATQGTPPYTFSATGNPPPGVALNPTTGALSGTLTTAGTFTFSIVATDSSSPVETGQQSYTFTVTPLPLTLACDLPVARLYTPYTGSQGPAGCTGVNGTPPYSYALTSGTLPPGLSFDPKTGFITGIPTTLGNYPISVQVTDASTPAMVASQSPTVSVQYGTITASGSPLFTLSALPISVDPGGNAPSLTLTPNESLLQAISGTATLSFKASPLVMNTPAGYQDPALQFVDSQGNPTGSTFNFTIGPGLNPVTIPGFNVGTVGGTVTITVAVADLTQAEGSLVVPATAPPVIEAGSVQFTNVTSTSFDVELVATTATRAASTVTITFNPTPGDTLLGQNTFVFDVSTVSADWFASDSGLKYGGRYSLTFPFLFNGPVAGIASATLTLNETAGNPSQPVTGSR